MLYSCRTAAPARHSGAPDCAILSTVTSPAGPRIEVPEALVSWHRKFFGETGRAWIDTAPDLAADLLDRWQLRPDGASTCGATALVLPVVRADATPAVLKLQPVTDHTVGEPDALRAWNGNGAVRLLDHDPESGSMLLERLDADRSLATVRDDLAALEILSELLARLSSVPASAGMRQLSDFGADLLERAPRALTHVRDPSQHGLIQACASALEEVLSEAGDRLVHEDLHFDNILGPHPADQREPWLAIDPTRWPAIPASRSSQHCTTGGRKPSPPTTYRVRSAAAST